MKIILGLSLFMTFSAFALPTARVLKVKGDVHFGKDALKKGSQINKSGTLIVADKSFIKIRVDEWASEIVVGPNSKMELNLSSQSAEKKYLFIDGACRWVTKQFENKKKENGTIYTSMASLGVRGTDYILKANQLLGETEIVVLEGKVSFENLQDKSDRALISKGQWGGLGGRFGQIIGKVLDLPANVIDHFDNSLKY